METIKRKNRFECTLEFYDSATRNKLFELKIGDGCSIVSFEEIRQRYNLLNPQYSIIANYRSYVPRETSDPDVSLLPFENEDI